MTRVTPFVENADGWSDWELVPVEKRKGLHEIRTFCCSCGLAHDEQYKKIGKHLYMRVSRNMKATAAARRGRKKK